MATGAEDDHKCSGRAGDTEPGAATECDDKTGYDGRVQTILGATPLAMPRAMAKGYGNDAHGDAGHQVFPDDGPKRQLFETLPQGVADAKRKQMGSVTHSGSLTMGPEKGMAKKW